jgi:hypothetical protein
LSAQEKVSKEKGSPAALIGCADALSSSPLRGAHNPAGKPASNSARALFPGWLRYSLSADGHRVAGYGAWILHPSGAAVHRRDFESQRASLSSWIC